MKHVKWKEIPPLSGPDPRGLIKETKQGKQERLENINGRHRQITIKKGDTVVMSSRVIPGNEQLVGRAINKLCGHWEGPTEPSADVRRRVRAAPDPKNKPKAQKKRKRKRQRKRGKRR